MWACSVFQQVQNVPVDPDNRVCLRRFSTPRFELLLLFMKHLRFSCSAKNILKTEKISLCFGSVAQGGGGDDKKHWHRSNQSCTRSDRLFNSWPRAVLRVRKEITALLINLWLCMFCFSQHTHTWYCSYILFIWQGRNKKRNWYQPAYVFKSLANSPSSAGDQISWNCNKKILLYLVFVCSEVGL